MVTIRTSDTHPLHIDVVMEPPNVYLDQCAIADFADSPQLGDDFRTTLLDKKGTLCISGLHLLELSGLCPGNSYTRIQTYLTSFGRHFAILDFDPNSVLARERGPSELRPRAPIDFELTKELVLKWNGLSEISLGIILGVLTNDSSLVASLRQAHVAQKQSIHDDFKQFRQLYLSDTKAKERVNKSKCPDPGQSSVIDYLYCEVRRICLRQDLGERDTFDFFHSIVSVSYADFVVLDKKWAARLRNIRAVPGMSKIFGANEYPAFLREFAA